MIYLTLTTPLIILGLVIVLLLVLIIWMVKSYNQFVFLRIRVEMSWSQIDIQLKRRFSLIPNLVDITKGYAKHEKELLISLAEARNLFNQSSNQDDTKLIAQAESGLNTALNRLVAVSEAYPDLKANEHFQSLMDELSETEDKITYSRQFYNDHVSRFNTKIEMFPSKIVAKMFNFHEKPFYEVTDAIKKEPIDIDL